MCGDVFHCKPPLPAVLSARPIYPQFKTPLKQTNKNKTKQTKTPQTNKTQTQQQPVIPQDEHLTVLLFVKAGWCSSERGNSGSWSGLASRDRVQAAKEQVQTLTEVWAVHQAWTRMFKNPVFIQREGRLHTCVCVQWWCSNSSFSHGK